VVVSLTPAEHRTFSFSGALISTRAGGPPRHDEKEKNMKRQVSSKSSIAICAMSTALGLWASACEGDGSDRSRVEPTQAQRLSGLPELEGKTYVLDIPGAKWTAPQGLGDDIAQVQPKFAFQVLAVDVSSLRLTARVGAAKGGVQDPCNKTYVVSGALNSDAMTFTLGPASVQTILVGPASKALATSHGFTITGQIVDQGAGLISGRLTAELDALELYPLFYVAQPKSGEELCALFAAAGLGCKACSFEPSVALCIDFAAEGFVLSESRSLSLADVPAFDGSCL
jgi:hypothetical protein